MGLYGQPSNKIIVCGEEYELASDVKVVTFNDNPEFSFQKSRANFPQYKYYYDRWIKGKGIRVDNVEQLAEQVSKIVLHTDCVIDAALCFKSLEAEGFSTHFIIDWDGTIYQCVDPQYTALHAGEFNSMSVGIDLNNEMPNVLDPSVKDKKYPWEKVPKWEDLGAKEKKDFKRQLSPIMKINGGRFRTYGFTDPQYIALIELCKMLVKLMPKIKPQSPMDETGEVIKNILEDMGFEGVLAHWHLSATRWDPGPGFDWMRLVAGLSSEHNSFPVLLEGGKNIATLLDEKRVSEEMDKYFINNESRPGGGYYPVGLNQNWHGGIHLHLKEKEPVRAMYQGELVAARFTEEVELGSANFILLRHELKIPKKNDEPKTFRFFTLYMHLQPMEIAVDADDPPAWLKWAYKLAKGEDVLEDEPKLEGKEKKKKPDDDDEDEDDDLKLDLTEDEESLTYLEVGIGLPALKQGKIALFSTADQKALPVIAGEPIGKVGFFGTESTRHSMVHVEVFCGDEWKKAVDMSKHAKFLHEVEEDMEDDLVCDPMEILSNFSPKKNRIKEGRRIITQAADIEELYIASDDEEFTPLRRRLRKFVTRHISEWSDQVDWIKALSSAQEWDATLDDIKAMITHRGEVKSGIFTDELKRILPFSWLNAEVAKKVGIDREPWDGILYHFHPLHFLWWATFKSAARLRVISSGKSAKQLKKEQKKLQNKLEAEKDNKIRDINSELFREGNIIWEVAAGDAENPKEILQDLDEPLLQGQWEIPVPEDW